MKWKQLFDSKIIKRGKDIYKHNLIHHVEVKDGLYKVIIAGTHDYHVEMKVNANHQIAYMKCDCPYAKLNHHCKHMAALCCYVEDNIEEKKDHEILDSSNKINDLQFNQFLKRLDKEQIIDYVSILSRKNPDIKDDFIDLYRDATSDDSIHKYVKQVMIFLDRYQKDIWDIDDLDKLLDEVCTYINDCIDSLLGHNKPLLAFHFINEFAFMIVNHKFIDKDIKRIYMNMIYGIWKRIKKKASTNQIKEMKDWFIRKIDENVHPMFYNYILKCLIYEYRDIYALGIKLDLIAKEIQKERIIVNVDNGYDTYDELVNMRYKIIQKVAYTREELEAFEKFPAFVPIVREIKTIQAIYEGTLSNAIVSLEKSMKLDKNKRYKLLLDYELLIMIQMSIHNKNPLKELLYAYLIELKQFQPSFVATFKELCTEKEWEEYRNLILENCSRIARFDFFLIDENYQQLYDELVEENDLDIFFEYTDKLIKVFPKKVYQYYHQAIIAMLYQKPFAISVYRKVIAILEYLKSFGENKIYIDEIVDDLYKTFADRDDLLALLEKYGY